MNAPDFGRTARSALASMVMLLALVSCSAEADGADPVEAVDPASEPAESGDETPLSGDDAPAAGDGAPDTGAGSSPDSQADEVDYSDDAGTDLVVHEYPDDPEPPEESVRTLCNLNQEYFQSLRAESPDGDPIVDDNLRLAALSMSDNLLLWESMRSHYPGFDSAIDNAWLVRDYWHDALVHYENGDETEARQAMLDAEQSISDLPDDFNDVSECAD